MQAITDENEKMNRCIRCQYFGQYAGDPGPSCDNFNPTLSIKEAQGRCWRIDPMNSGEKEN